MKMPVLRHLLERTLNTYACRLEKISATSDFVALRFGDYK